MVRTFAAVLAMLAFLTSCATPQGGSGAVLYEGARLIPGDGSPAIEASAFVVEGDAIVRVGRRGEVTAPAGARRVDLTGKTVMPTIYSTHVHPGFQRGLSYAAEHFNRQVVMDDLNRALYFGIAVVMSQGIEKGDLLDRMRAEQAAGTLGGARLLIAGAGIGAPNAGPGGDTYKGIAYEVTTEAQMRTAIRELSARRVDAVKIWVDDRNGRAPRLSPPLFRAAIDEGHRHGLRVCAHVFYHADTVELVEAGIDSMAHLMRDQVMSDALVAAVKQRGVYVMPNLGAAERWTHTQVPGWMTEPALLGLLRDTVPAAVVERMQTGFASRDGSLPARARVNVARRQYPMLQQSVAKLARADARVIVGSDTGLEDHFFGYAEQRELELMANSGMTPMQVIVAATSRGAEYLKLPRMGSLAPGKVANFLVLDANPLDDIRNTRRIARMVVDGKEVDRAAVRAAIRN